MYAGIHLASVVFGTETRSSQSDVLKGIVGATDAGAKIDRLARYLLTPDQSPWYEPFREFVAGAAAYVVVYFLGTTFLPKMTPSSHIAIGLSKHRAELSNNRYRLLFGALFVGGILQPIVTYLFKHIAKLFLK